MAYEIREALKPYDKMRIEVRGILDGFDIWIHRGRDSLRACVIDPEVNHRVVSHHVWVVGCHNWEEHRDKIGQVIRFHARVEAYIDNKRGPGQTNYCLSDPDEPIFPNLPAFKIPDPKELKGGMNGSQDIKAELDKVKVLKPLVPIVPMPKPPAPPILTAPSPAPKPAPPPPTPEPEPVPKSTIVTQPVDAVSMLKLAKKFQKVCGRMSRAKEVATFLRDHPVDPATLLAWIEALQEE